MKPHSSENLDEPTEPILTIPSFIFGSPENCTYCGETPNALDHVIPVSQYSVKKRKAGGKERGVRTYACTQCNSILGDKYFDTFLERIMFVRGRLTEKAGRNSRKAAWDDDEILELSGSIRNYVASKQFKIRAMDRRTEWPLSFRFYQAIGNLDTVHALTPSHPKYQEWVHAYFASVIR